MRYDGIFWLLGEVELAFASHNLSETQDLNNQRGYITRSLDHNSNKVDVRKYINLNKVEWMFGAQAEDLSLIHISEPTRPY